MTLKVIFLTSSISRDAKIASYSTRAKQIVCKNQMSSLIIIIWFLKLRNKELLLIR